MPAWKRNYDAANHTPGSGTYKALYIDFSPHVYRLKWFHMHCLGSFVIEQNALYLVISSLDINIESWYAACRFPS